MPDSSRSPTAPSADDGDRRDAARRTYLDGLRAAARFLDDDLQDDSARAEALADRLRAAATPWTVTGNSHRLEARDDGSVHLEPIVGQGVAGTVPALTLAQLIDDWRNPPC
ncbi:MAG: hypothetical protein AAF772_10090 [Acidobacteriota bacterium]